MDVTCLKKEYQSGKISNKAVENAFYILMSLTCPYVSDCPCPYVPTPLSYAATCTVFTDIISAGFV